MLKPFFHMTYPDRADLWSLGSCLYSMLTGRLTNKHYSCAHSYTDAFKYPEHMQRLLSDSIFELLEGMLEFLPQHR